MKRYFLYGILCVLMLTACNKGSENTDAEQQQAMEEATREELAAALSERDQLLEIINGIVSDLDSIKTVERIITINGVGEGSTRTAVANDLAAIKSTLAERREKLASLEARLKESKLSNSKLMETVETLKKQITAQENQIAELTENLGKARERIAELGNQVDSLHNEIDVVAEERNAAQEEAIRQANEANKCYYAIGSKKELKEHNIIEGGFLRKTKIMETDFDKTFFIQGDKRTLTTIPLHSKKAKIVTKQPASSYQLTEVNGQMVLNIINPAEFWGVSNYVVIQVD